ncbi:MAG TPA: glycosyltransferase family 9 protein, partial [Cytophagaceae bacterium]
KLNVRSYSFDKLNFRKWLLVNLKVDKMPRVHIVDRYLATAKTLGVINDGLGLDYFIPEKDVIDKKTLPFPFTNGYAAFAIGAQHFTKRLPEIKVVEFCKQIKLPIILLGGKEDREGAERITAALNDPQKVLNYCGKVNLHQSASLAQQSETVYVNDTGMMHIAAALKKPIVSFWGNTTPLFGMYAYKTENIIVENNTLPCRPCSKIGYSKCPKGHFKCMSDLQLPLPFPK